MSRPLFAMWPKRAHELFRRGDLTADDVHLLLVVVTEADHETREAVFPNLASLRSELGWDRGRTATTQHVRNCLERVRALGEISFNIQRGQRAPLVIKVEKPDYFQRSTPSVLDVTSNDGKSGTVAASDTPRPRRHGTSNVGGARVTDRDTDTDLDVLNRPVGERSQVESLEATQAAAALADAINPEHCDAGTREVVLKYAQEMPAADIREVHRALEAQRGAIRNEGRWVNGALAKKARKRAAA